MRDRIWWVKKEDQSYWGSRYILTTLINFANLNIGTTKFYQKSKKKSGLRVWKVGRPNNWLIRKWERKIIFTDKMYAKLKITVLLLILGYGLFQFLHRQQLQLRLQFSFFVCSVSAVSWNFLNKNRNNLLLVMLSRLEGVLVIIFACVLLTRNIIDGQFSVIDIYNSSFREANYADSMRKLILLLQIPPL